MDFWMVHGIWFIIFLLFFPRLTMLATGIFMTFISPLFFLGWLLVPRLTIAFLASTFYFQTNPILCILAWIWAVTAELGEKTITIKRS